MKKDKSEKKQTLAARKAAQNFIRPYVLKGDTMPLLPAAKLRHETKEYSAHIEGENVVVSKLNGIAVQEIFSLNEIMQDISMEYSYGKGMADITADTAKEAYEKRIGQITLLLKELKKKLREHNKKFKSNPLNWGYAGDMAHVQVKLQEIVSFLK